MVMDARSGTPHPPAGRCLRSNCRPRLRTRLPFWFLTASVKTILPPLGAFEHARLVRRAKLLAWGGNGWHLIEFAIAVGAGVAASSIALIGFGLDSLIESLAGFI